ncbi:hypothetical protein [Deinococcus budaensis]|uniref:Uncharacterized protein n=1 Tax=Deinococcus budaensis TaxID=1665626 RepID=A0A7W8GH09_9DEIO|nr:hypothetical protein [Deinococcus budaensis]MBB5235169.1 hypothetical protein [Deinococcus budaensis]
MSCPDIPPTVTAYLDGATRLLPLHARATTRRELHANLHQTMLDHLTAGIPEAEAWAAALRDFGPPTRTALGLARTHTLPLLLRALLMAGALGGAASALWTHAAPTTAPVQEARP